MRLGMKRAATYLMIAGLMALVPVAAMAEDAKAKVPTPLPAEDVTETIPGTTIRIDMVRIPGGKFMMAPLTKDGQPKEVTVKPFWIAQTECLWEQFDTYAFQLDVSQKDQAAGVEAKARPSKPYANPDRDYGHAGYPVLSVTAKSASMYCVWLNKKTGHKYRLPTEAEFEYACRAGGEVVKLDAKALNEIAWFKDNSDDKTQPAKQKKPNAWGLYDMIGNAGEWTTPMEGNVPVLRGGWFKTKAAILNCATRHPFNPDWQMIDPNDPKSTWWLSDGTFTGFRVVRED